MSSVTRTGPEFEPLPPIPARLIPARKTGSLAWMQGQYSNREPYYRCRYPKEYALASNVRHPANVYMREADLLPAIYRWLTTIFAPHRLGPTTPEIQAAP